MNRDDIRDQVLPALNEQLDDLARAHQHSGGFVIKAIGRSEVRAQVASVDRLACEVELISVSNPRLNSASMAELQPIADQLSNRLSYLEETLVVLELDQLTPQIQMRSQTPRVDNESRSYLEVQVGRICTTLQRFSKTSESRRVVVPAAMTRDVFTRVCIDLVFTLSG